MTYKHCTMRAFTMLEVRAPPFLLRPFFSQSQGGCTGVPLSIADCEARSGWYLHRKLSSLWTFITNDGVWAQAPWSDSDPDCQTAGLAPSTRLFLNMSAAFAAVIVTKLSSKLSCAGHGYSWRNCRLPHPLDWKAAQGLPDVPSLS